MKVKWGVIGTSGIAKSCSIPGMQTADNCELYAIAGRNQDKVDAYKEQFRFKVGYVGYENLLADPNVQAVYIPLPNNIHKEWVIKALNAGKHVLCEKPLGLNANEVRAMHECAKKNNVLLMEAYAYLHSEYVKSLKNDVASGIIGDIVYIDTAFLTQGYEDNIRLKKELGGSMIYDLGCYCTTMILTLVDSDIDYVKAQAEFTDEGVDNFSGALIKFKNGVRASFNAGMILGLGKDARYDRLFIHGTKGDIRSEVEYNQCGELSYRIFVDGQTIVRNVPTSNNYGLETAQLSRCILGNETPYITEAFSVRNAELLDTLLREIGY